MKQFILKSGLVVFGGVFQGFGMGVFLFPQSIPSGGAGGLAILLNHWLPISMGPALWIVNFSLLLLGINYLGKRFGLWTLIGITITSVSIHFFEQYIIIVHRSIGYDLIIGSVFIGTGIGLLMRTGVSNGGVGVLAFMISHQRNILPGKPLFLINCSIFFITAVIISWKIFFLALISQWISTRVVDFIFEFNVNRLPILANKK